MRAFLRPDFSLSMMALARSGCLWWLTPEAEWSEDTNDAAQAGTLLHHALATLVKGGTPTLPDDPVLHAMFAHAKAWLQESKLLGLDGLRAEVPFAYDTATGEARELEDPPGLEGTRWYADRELRELHGMKPTEVGTRIDLVCWWGGSVALILDYKFHFRPKYVNANAQLEACAAVVSRAWGVERVQAIGLHVWEDVEPQPEEPGELGPSGELELGAMTLDTIAAGIDKLADRPANDPIPHEGTHCEDRYCKARATCPVTQKTVGAALALIPAEQLTRARGEYAWNAPVTTNDHAAWKLIRLQLLKVATKAAEEELRAFADASNGVHFVDDGSVYSGQDQAAPESPDLTAPGAIEVLQELGLDFAVQTKTTWADIKREGGTDAEKRARAALRDIDALKFGTPKRVYDIRVPKAGSKAHRAKRAS